MILSFFKKIILLSIFIPVISFAYLSKEEVAAFGANLCHTHDGIYLENGKESDTIGQWQLDYRFDIASKLDQPGKACMSEARTLNPSTEKVEQGFVGGNGFGTKCTVKGEKDKCNGYLHSYEVKELCDSYNNSQKFTNPEAECNRRGIICEWGDPNTKDYTQQSKCFARHIPYELCQPIDNLQDSDAKRDACNKANKVCRLFSLNDQISKIMGWTEDTCIAKNRFKTQDLCGPINSWSVVSERQGLCGSYGCNWVDKDSTEGVSLGLTESTCRSTLRYTDPFQAQDINSDTPAFDCSGKGYFWTEPAAQNTYCEDIFYKKTDKYLNEEITIGCHFGLSCVYKPPVIMVTVDEDIKVPVEDSVEEVEVSVPVTLPTTIDPSDASLPIIPFLPIDPLVYTPPYINPTQPGGVYGANSCPDISGKIKQLQEEIKAFRDTQNISSNPFAAANYSDASMLLGRLDALLNMTLNIQYYESQY